MIADQVGMCECGCGQYAKVRRKFAIGHSNRKKPSWNKGKSSWNKGLTKENDERMAEFSLSLKKAQRRPRLPHQRRRGYNRPQEVKDKISKALQGRTKSEETCAKMSIARRGKNSPLYVDGRSFRKERYNPHWNSALKRKILKRDNHECQLCHRKRKKGEKELHIHHIDYDRQNCKTGNLITLCQNCHMKTNTHREKWILFFCPRTIVGKFYKREKEKGEM